MYDGRCFIAQKNVYPLFGFEMIRHKYKILYEVTIFIDRFEMIMRAECHT